jgi:hypothetical protein
MHLEAHMALIQAHIPGTFFDLVFNLDEVASLHGENPWLKK